MSDQTTAAPSPAETPDVFNGQSPSLHEFMKFRETGEVPERFKPSDSAAAEPAQDSSESEPLETDPDSETGQKQQEKQDRPKNQTASERIAKLNEKLEELWQEEDPDTVKIAQITATIEKIERGAGLKRKTEVAPVTEAPKQQPQAQSQPQYTRPKPAAEDKDASGNPKYSTYEDFVEDLADWKAEQRMVAADRERQRQSQIQEISKKVSEARERYGDTFEDVLVPTVDVIVKDAAIPAVIKEMLNDSDVSPDLVYTLGSDPAEFAKFLRLAKEAPGKAIRYLAAVEAGIQEELAGAAKTADRDENGQFVSKEPPAKQKTSAPKPPSPVGGASASAFDVSDESLSPEEWMRKRNADLAKRKA